MSIDTISKLLEENKTVSFSRASDSSSDRGNFVCKIETNKDFTGKHKRGDTVYYLYADTFLDLLNKIERKYQ